MKYVKSLLPLLLLFFFLNSNAQQNKTYPGFYDEISNKLISDSTSKIFVSNINIIGNKKTKKYIILREMKVKKGDSVLASKLFEILEQSRDLVYNTTLFTDVEIQPLLTTAYTLSITVIVKERWYIFPIPQFKLIDRNLNEWVKDYNADLNRVIYGAKFAHYNFSGRADQLRIYVLNGYTRSVLLSYTTPYSNKKLTEGYSVAFGYTENREFPYKTTYKNGLVQFRKSDFERSTLSAAATYQLRRGYFRKHLFSLQYNNIKINDSVLTDKYNPNYFNSSKSTIGYPDISYSFQYIKTNNINYPLTGKIYHVTASKRGLGFTGGINMFTIDATYKKFIPHKKNYYSMFEVLTKLKAPFYQAYINQRAMGYNDLYLRGLENYVIDGFAAAISKYTLKKKIVSFNIPLPFKIKAFPGIPFTIFAKTFADAGFSFNKKEFDTRLNNRFLYSGGFGLDILTLYDFSIRFEYSFNQLGENGLFLHTRTSL